MGPQNIDMGLIREAMQRRQQGGSMPVGGQMTASAGPSATGGMPTPTPVVGQPQNQGVNMPPPQQPQRPQQGAGGGALSKVAGGNFDEETKQISKALVKKLIQYL